MLGHFNNKDIVDVWRWNVKHTSFVIRLVTHSPDQIISWICKDRHTHADSSSVRNDQAFSTEYWLPNVPTTHWLSVSSWEWRQVLAWGCTQQGLLARRLCGGQVGVGIAASSSRLRRALKHRCFRVPVHWLAMMVKLTQFKTGTCTQHQGKQW